MKASKKMGTQIVECRWGKQLIYDTDMWFWRLLTEYGDYNRGEEMLFRSTISEGATVIEAGAHAGCHTMTLSEIVGKHGTVMAFEPQPPIYWQLCGTIAINDVKNVIPMHAALGEGNGTIGVPAFDYSVDQNFGGMSLRDVPPNVPCANIPLLTIDALRLPRLDFIKIDVEGFETAVLRGGRETIARHRPYLYVEIDREDQRAETVQTMLDMGYKVFEHHPHLYSPDNFKGNPNNFCPNVVSMMAFGVPDEREFVTDLPRIMQA